MYIVYTAAVIVQVVVTVSSTLAVLLQTVEYLYLAQTVLTQELHCTPQAFVLLYLMCTKSQQ